MRKTRALASMKRNVKGDTKTINESEMQIFALLCEGLTEQDIAYKLAVSFNTIHNKAARIRSRLEVRTREEAVNIAFDRGMFKVTDSNRDYAEYVRAFVKFISKQK